MFKRILSTALVFGVVAAAPPVHAQSACGDRTRIVTGLASKYGEAHIGGGLQSSNKMVEVWTSEKTGSFTILVTTADGKSCVVSTGNSWISFETGLAPTGTPS